MLRRVGRVRPTRARWRFDGRIAGWGTAEGTRCVVGWWDASPLGAFADVMVEQPDGRRVLLAPSDAVAAFVASTYTFDEVRVVPVRVAATVTVPADAAGPGEHADRRGARWRVDAGPLAAELEVGRRTASGWAVRGVPPRVSRSARFTVVTDSVARRVLRGVRTRGSAGSGRVECYGASDVHALVAARTSWEGVDLGAVAPVHPPVRFGFGSAPRSPAVTRLVTTVVEAPSGDETRQ